MHYVRDSARFVRAPRGLRELDRRWTAAERDLWSELGRAQTERESSFECAIRSIPIPFGVSVKICHRLLGHSYR